MSLSGKGKRNKGVSFERAIAAELRLYDSTAKRVLEYQQGKGFDVEGNDLVIQCKAKKSIQWLAAYRELPCQDRCGDKLPLVVGKIDHQGEYVFLKWEDFLEIYKWIVIGKQLMKEIGELRKEDN